MVNMQVADMHMFVCVLYSSTVAPDEINLTWMDNVMLPYFNTENKLHLLYPGW